MEPEVLKGDIVNLAPYHFYMKVSNDLSENAFSGVTVPLDLEPSDEIKKAVLTYSREKYSTPRKEVEEYLERLFMGLDKKPLKTKTAPESAQAKLIDYPINSRKIGRRRSV